MEIVEAWLTDVHRVLQDEPLRVGDLRIGVFYTAARLSSGHVGVAFTPRELHETVCCQRSAAEAPAAGRLAAAHSARAVVLAGPTASPWPPPFFARGVHMLGGIRVQNGERMLQLVSEGGSGYFFAGAAEKICVLRDC